MTGMSLTQYISTYREIILKLDNSDDFHKMRAFIRGLDAEYTLHVRIGGPKNFEETTVKQSQTFDDDQDKKGKNSVAKST